MFTIITNRNINHFKQNIESCLKLTTYTMNQDIVNSYEEKINDPQYLVFYYQNNQEQAFVILKGYECQYLSMSTDSVLKELLPHLYYMVLENFVIEVKSEFVPLFESLGYIHHENRCYYRIETTYQFDNYEQVQEFILQQPMRVYALDHFKNLMTLLGNVQNKLQVIHIGGTNGKGSTTNYVREVLQNEGYRVGTFTSPALVSRCEIIRINNEHIPEETMCIYANRYMEVCLENQLSMFEIEVFISVMYFVHNAIDLSIFEVGLGGELDATNIVTPLISAITNIGMDHVDFLGDSYEQIATTKAGIIKEGCTFITGEKKEVCLNIFKTICDQKNIPMVTVQPINDIKKEDHSLSYIYNGETISLQTKAVYQCFNSALAYEILMCLKNNHHYHLTTQVILDGLRKAKWAGRFEIILNEPEIIIDGAHNKEGIVALVESAKQLSKRTVLFSALKDKDTHSMIEHLLTLDYPLIISQFEFERAALASDLKEDFPVQVETDWKKVIDEHIINKQELLITGSLYFIAQVRKYIFEKMTD